MSEGNSKQIKLGMIVSYLNIIVGNLIPLLYTPIMLDLLGQNEYGLYKMASTTTSYLSLMALGIGSAVTKYLVKARVEGGQEAEEKMFGLFNLIFQVIALLSLLVGGIIVWKLDVVYGTSLTDVELAQMRILVAILVLNMAVGFSSSSYNAVLHAHERYIFIHVINFLSSVASPMLNLVVLFLGFRSIGMVSVSLGINVFIRIINLVFIRRTLHLRPRYRAMPLNAVSEIFSFSFWVFVGNIVGQIYSSTDVVIIGAIPALATVGAAVYSVGSTFSNMMFSIAQVTPTLFLTSTNRMVFSGCSDDELTGLMIKVGRMQCFIVALVCSGFIAFGKPFIDFYAGPEYADAYWVAVLVMIPNCIPLVQTVALNVIQAKNMHRFRSIVYLLIALLNIVGTLLLVNRFGVIGAAVPTGLAYILGQGLIMNWYYWKKVHLDIPRFWKSLLPNLAIAAIMCILTLLLSNWIDFYTPYVMFVGIIVYSATYCVCLWLFVMTSDERKEITRVRMKFKRKAG